MQVADLRYCESVTGDVACPDGVSASKSDTLVFTTPWDVSARVVANGGPIATLVA